MKFTEGAELRFEEIRDKIDHIHSIVCPKDKIPGKDLMSDF